MKTNAEISASYSKRLVQYVNGSYYKSGVLRKRVIYRISQFCKSQKPEITVPWMIFLRVWRELFM